MVITIVMKKCYEDNDVGDDDNLDMMLMMIVMMIIIMMTILTFTCNKMQ